MADTYVCKRCGRTGVKNEIPYKIIDTRNDKIVFKGQLCDECFDKFFGRPPKTEDTNEKTK